MDPYVAEIRVFLTEKFSDEDIEIFCSDYFHDVQNSFSTGMSKVQKIQLLIDYCVRRNTLSHLLAALRKTQPGVFGELDQRLRQAKPEMRSQYTPSPRRFPGLGLLVGAIVLVAIVLLLIYGGILGGKGVVPNPGSTATSDSSVATTRIDTPTLVQEETLVPEPTTPPIPKPAVMIFSVTPSEINRCDSVTAKWEVIDADTVILQTPDGKSSVEPAGATNLHLPVGESTLTLVANRQNESVQQSHTVKVLSSKFFFELEMDSSAMPWNTDEKKLGMLSIIDWCPLVSKLSLDPRAGIRVFWPGDVANPFDALQISYDTGFGRNVLDSARVNGIQIVYDTNDPQIKIVADAIESGLNAIGKRPYMQPKTDPWPFFRILQAEGLPTLIIARHY